MPVPLPIILLALPFVAILAGLLARTEPTLARLHAVATVAGLALATVICLVPTNAHGALGGLIIGDALSKFEALLVWLVGVAVVWQSRTYVTDEGAVGTVTMSKLRLYYSLVQGLLALLTAAYMVDSALLYCVALEATTLASVFLISFSGRHASLEAAWKFLMLCAVGLALALVGLTLLNQTAGAVAPGASSRLAWSTLVALGGRLDPHVVELACVFALVGFGTKAGLAPMHNWLPDTYSQAPAPVSALLAGALSNGSMYGIMRMLSVAEGGPAAAFVHQLLVGFGMVSLAIAAIFVVHQRGLKRMFAYSSVEHGGIIALALGFGGKLGFYAAILHTLFHSLIKPVAFFSAGQFHQWHRTKAIQELAATGETLPQASALMTLSAAGLAGMPPSGIFFSEFLVVKAGLEGNHFWAVGILLLALVAIFGGFLAHVTTVAMGADEPKPVIARAGEFGRWAPGAGLLALAIVGGLYLPPAFVHVLELAARTIGG